MINEKHNYKSLCLYHASLGIHEMAYTTRFRLINITLQVIVNHGMLGKNQSCYTYFH